MKISTARFGDVEVPRDKLITMERPILGFESLKRFCLVEVEELKPFLWLQSTDQTKVAFLVVNPAVICPDYRIEINSNEIAELQVSNAESVETYVIVTIPDDPRRMSVNLQGPVLINSENNRAKQLVLVNSGYEVQQSVLEMLDRHGVDLHAETPTDATEEELVPA
ncbi:MAG: flagellar assembly protein FliW [Candidatus Zixiibacteriota bacterium]|nr:MAG: flagellar assembly protein FliW [candidate division Zixibacteria bacterium]